MNAPLTTYVDCVLCHFPSLLAGCSCTIVLQTILSVCRQTVLKTIERYFRCLLVPQIHKYANITMGVVLAFALLSCMCACDAFRAGSVLVPANVHCNHPLSHGLVFLVAKFWTSSQHSSQVIFELFASCADSFWDCADLSFEALNKFTL